MLRFTGTILLAAFISISAAGIWPECLNAGALSVNEAGGEKPNADSEIRYEDAPELLREIERLERLYPEQSPGAPKFDRSGHQYTTFIIARIAGLDRELSHKLAYFSQFPDDVTKYSATNAAVFKLFNQTYRKQIMATLHSLHGGGEDAVLSRRKILKDLIQDGIQNKTLEPYQVGLVIHAFADAYAHTTVENGKLVAFGSRVGHLWHGHDPDIIAYDPPKYKEYACNLFMALAMKNTCQPYTDDLMKMIEGLKKSRNAELMKFESFSKEKYQFSENYYSQGGKEWEKNVREEDVISTIKLMESKFEHN